MKKKSNRLLKSLLFLLPVIGLIIFACNKEQNKTANLQGTPVTLSQDDTLDNGLVLPAGSVLSITADKPKTIQIKFPKNFQFVGITTGNVAVNVQAMDITCACTGGGCSPYVNSHSSGCILTGTCADCKKTMAATVASRIVEFSEGITIDMSQQIHFITTQKELVNSLPVSPAMLADSFIVSALQGFISSYQKDDLDLIHNQDPTGTLPDSYALIPVSFYGRSILVPVEKSITPAYAATISMRQNNITSMSTVTLDDASGGGFSCSCGVGTGCASGVFWVPFIGVTHYCNSGVCSACTLHTPAA